MSASRPKTTDQLANYKDDERFGRYHDGLLPLASAPFGIMLVLNHFHLFEELASALQWFLMALVLLGGISTAWILILPGGRSYWVRPSRANGWGAFVVTVSTLMIAMTVTLFFAHVSAFLYRQGIAAISPERPLSDP